MDTQPASKSFTRFFPAIARFLMGLPLLIFGANLIYPYPFLPEPDMSQTPEEVLAFTGALANSGYMMQLIGAT